MSKIRLKGSEPVLPVSDILRTIRFYRDTLGFESEWTWGEPPVHAGVRWNNIQLMFHKNEDPAKPIGPHAHYLFVDDVQNLHAQHMSRGVKFESDIANQPWGVCEYSLRDPDGHRLTFAGPTIYQKPPEAADSMPEYARIDLRKPTIDEYVALRRSVHWGTLEQHAPGVLASTLFGIVATDARDDAAIGMLRVCGDGMYFTIWDVVVHPNHQGHKIGAAMMELAMKEIRKRSATGAFVGLFTPRPGFYVKFGFTREAGGMSTQL
jgi:uncharacterized glyoxalase superfamily protein PhnB/ribosomal protein S18 acetylase RimI-like enzyme